MDSLLYGLNSEGTAATAQGVFTIRPGQQSIVASYSGDAGFNPSLSAPVNITVTKAPTTTTMVSSSSSVIQGTPVTLTATVNTSSGGFGPTGLANFMSGSNSGIVRGEWSDRRVRKYSIGRAGGGVRNGNFHGHPARRPKYHHSPVCRRFELYRVLFRNDA